MKILHVSQPTDYGVARCVAALAADQVRRGWSVTVACPPEGWLAEAVQDGGAALAPWNAVRELGPAVAAETIRLRRLVRSAQPSVVHLHSSKAGLAGRLALRGRIPTIFHTHAWSFLALDRPMATLAIAWERWAVRWAAAVVCCSKGEAELGRAAGITGPLVVVPNAVDTSLIPRDEAARSGRRSLRSELGIANAPLVVCIGRLSHQKGQDLLLEAWPAVRAAVADARLALVGKGPYRPEVTRLLSAGAEIIGHRPDTGAWLVAADVVAVPSRYDTMPLTLLEALAVGRSVVVSDAPGVAEAIEGADPPAGAVVPVGNTAAMSAALAVRLMNDDLRDAEGRAARVHADREHSLTRWLDQLAELAESVSVSAPGAAAPSGR